MPAVSVSLTNSGHLETSNMARLIKDSPWWIVLIYLFIGTLFFFIVYGLSQVPSSVLGDAPATLTYLPYSFGVGILLLYILVRRVFEGIWPIDMNLFEDARQNIAIKNLGLGILAGFAYFAVVTAGIAICGCYKVSEFHFDSVAFFSSLAAFFVVAVGEEVLFRGIIYRLIDQKWGMWPSLIVSALLFGFTHIFNDNATVWSSVAISIEAGLLLAVIYKYTGSLWAPIGLHWAWNFIQGPILGFAVSGNDTKSMFTAVISGPEILSGGAFGAEASIIACLVGLAASVYLVLKADKRKAL